MTTSNEMTKIVDSVFKKMTTHFYLLDIDFLKEQIGNFATSLAQSEQCENKVTEFLSFLKNLDSALGGGPNLKIGNVPMPKYAENARLAHLEILASKYLENREYYSSYLDWVLISAFLRIERDSYAREKSSSLEEGTEESYLLLMLNALSDFANKRVYSPKQLLDLITDAQKKGCFFHPVAISILQKKASENPTLFMLPSTARSPDVVEGSGNTGSQSDLAFWEECCKRLGVPMNATKDEIVKTFKEWNSRQIAMSETKSEKVDSKEESSKMLEAYIYLLSKSS